MSHRRRSRKARQLEKMKKKRRMFLLALLVFLAAFALAAFAVYYFSYTGTLGRGRKALGEGRYTEAMDCFELAAAKNEEKPDAYEGMAQVMLATRSVQDAEDVFLDAIEKQDTNADLYAACFQFYLEQKQPMKIPALLAQTDEKTLEALEEYQVEMPEYSLKDSEVYDDVQQLSLATDEAAIYYTTDGSDPDPSGTKYEEPIQLGEGTTVIKAIAVSKSGVPSQIAKKEYTIEFPVEDAPAVSPSTGQYFDEEQIEIKVPDGYTAYYTMNGDDPTTASTPYTGPVDMPEGETLFKAILINGAGRASSVTTRNYIRE